MAGDEVVLPLEVEGGNANVDEDAVGEWCTFARLERMNEFRFDAGELDDGGRARGAAGAGPAVELDGGLAVAFGVGGWMVGKCVAVGVLSSACVGDLRDTAEKRPPSSVRSTSCERGRPPSS